MINNRLPLQEDGDGLSEPEKYLVNDLKGIEVFDQDVPKKVLHKLCGAILGRARNLVKATRSLGPRKIPCRFYKFGDNSFAIIAPEDFEMTYSNGHWNKCFFWKENSKWDVLTAGQNRNGKIFGYNVVEKDDSEEEELGKIGQTIEGEGFDYIFRNYSDFKEIKDLKFHQLRKAYINAAGELEKYIEENKL